MKVIFSNFLFVTILVLATCDLPLVKRPLIYPLWAGKSAKQIALGRNKAALVGGKQRTLMVQIRSDQPVPLVLKGGRNSQLRYGPNHLRGVRPIKLTGPVYLKSAPIGHKPLQRKPLKIKLANTKPKHKPATSYEVPFRFEVPVTNNIAYPPLGNEAQQLPSETHSNFITEHDHDNDHFAPIHTIPAPNLSLPENHLQESYLPPKSQPQTYHQTLTNPNIENQYQVTEEHTNDQTIRDPLSGSQKLFAPDPDPSLPAAQLRPATEPFNQPSNGKPLPVDVQSNFIVPAQPLVQIIGAQEVATPEIYPIQFTQQAQLQPLVSANVAAVHAASAPIYDPTYLVTQSNQLYTQHQQQQQLFQPSASLLQAGYVNADLTQEIASDGQILQAAKDPHHNIHPVLDSAPQFAALIAAPALGEQSAAHYSLHPHAAALTATSAAPEGGFVVSNYYDNDGQDNSQLLQAYAEEEAQRLEIEAEQEKQQYVFQQQQQHLLALQQQQQQQELQQQELQQQQQLHLQLQEQQQLHQQLQEQQLHQVQEQQLHQQQLQQQELQHQQHTRHQQQSQDPASAAFHEHQRLVQQQLGADAPLRIFVPDDESAGEARLQKRSDMVKKGTVEDASAEHDNNTTTEDDMFEVSSSVEVSNNENQKDTATNEE
ncbi:PREDICTED: LOW QUALITY PROTEIN: putative uncharacterized protein DDB_G0271606 [Rhagoletis zephyria]|uniref:LOW QUALITY PROTEIN: putative uncharacterized protein DDB_G0271606 n=1 Tax=Rhagoletis zephyria TaxID=28612 RepID=UPI0008116557|nr:PREDICTED: LOW QUALITY PROTEIN: putative uncharacterized protein DDB_G0271606 [Rhagoletis zephyria]